MEEVLRVDENSEAASWSPWEQKQEQRKIYSKMGFTTFLSLLFLIGPILPPQARWQPTVARRPQTFFIWLQQNNGLELSTQKHSAPQWLAQV